MGRMCVLALLIIIMLLFEKRANQKKVDRKRQKEFQVKTVSAHAPKQSIAQKETRVIPNVRNNEGRAESLFD